MRAIIPDALKLQLRYPARAVGILGALAMAAAVFMPWAYGPGALDNMTLWASPSPLQLFFGVLALLVLALLAIPLVGKPKLGRWAHILAWNTSAKTSAISALAMAGVAAIAIAIELGGVVNLDPGAWVALVGGVLAVTATLFLPDSPPPSLERVKSAKWLQITGIALGMAAVLFGAAYGLGLSDAGAFLTFAAFLVGLVLILRQFGVFDWLSIAAANNRQVLVLSAFTVAFAFPFTQDGSDATMSVAAQVLIFAATALGLNIVVGLVGLLDLGYIAFLGAGAFTAAVLSESAFATIDFHPPFVITVLISGAVASLLGLVIGAPTLRVSGDYLAIVTLAFGEIFRITMNNLDGNDGPNLTHGSNGIPGIPDLSLLGFDFGQPHVILGIDIGRFANYYWLMLLVMGLIIVVFTNLNHSRIGRGWVAIREDELAAEAMGVNTFALKLLAFSGGAFLAGVAGAVKAHYDVSVTPDQYVFLESAFLLAAVVLGGMGTVAGVLIGATILKLLPEKLRFFSDYRLLLFGLLMVVMMRFRPEGIVADERRQLEFHDDSEELADEVEEELIAHHAHLNPDREVFEL
ncbi:branched-chain amino acid ABC transporter permease [Propionicimonas sp.]|uniref:branched-chain amino acid ABC transporter permease n=1 Tax=Propionicimonas sp. TaxID=1955623 RepID=UPI001849F027|nr:branched-chain amino acid ABC transporter permease [Propionicimonas sp.]MBU3976020.1 branched-chain amino acid ABC transporter permease [Actinomycetota bacterium]MBA3020834.1 branched-chain amino acid ABC transporter permease [Propionicimonas sp.]MBU3985210.1 branched-chain amino acid ABC transporter permease [Actinomycetota bacterium]MBU4008200.1 branched-chain amino acid ABC transporter permease [Actinomycetota bacterium]MBU4064586.1 branched-chain amino acid ABC transporter permease [Act